MFEGRAKYIQGEWFKTNAINLLGGIGIGTLIYLFISVTRGRFVQAQIFWTYCLFSVMISFCIMNSIYIVQTLFHLRYDRLSFIIAYYAACLVGMAAGTELANFILSLANGGPYRFFHLHDMLFSTLIVIIVCTISFVYHSQKSALKGQIRQKELDMMRLTQLKTQAELATLHARINPHFLYNALNSIASLIHHDADKAESMTLKLSKLFRYSINQNSEDLVLIRDEVETGVTYLDIEKIRFGDRIAFNLDVDPELMDAKIPRFLIQPLVENALKHGLKNVTEKGSLTIRIRREQELIEIVIADNGTPFPAELQTGYGLQSTYDKLSLLYGDNYQVCIANEPVKQIKILIPLRYE
ncbi:sensor histidine kinase [Arcticibacter tournemirensis]|uniref:Signal transduction histidine kinase internal region domain-containing protein n=1 Tax=Arcticibacter tournemirensis TaxID=699437 RepID=A0A4Q0M4C2_9SPHI|nr:histidine kinase [Arcticibacter tournemirensis]RXF67800.1 hypothetical protein EKH83_18430 [Arcticibacter tournemirensis]